MTKTPRRLVIHAGQHKTGTTSIQNALYRRDITVRGVDWSYPTLPGTQDHHAPMRMTRAAFQEGRRSAKLGLQLFSQRVRFSSGSVAILSAEGFSNMRPQDVAAFADIMGRGFDRVEIVVYARPHLSAINAVFAELIKNGESFANYATYYKNHGAQFSVGRKYLEWREVFGDRLTVRPFLRDELAGGSAVRDFAETVFPGAEIDVEERPGLNVTLGIADLMRLKVWHRTLAGLGVRTRHHLSWPMVDLMSLTAPTNVPKLRMHRALADRLAKELAPDAALFDAEFADGRPIMQEALERDRLAAADKPVSVKPADWLSADEINMHRAAATAFAKSHGRDPLWRFRLHRWYMERQRER